MRRILIATSNPRKIRDFAGAASVYGIEVEPLPNFSSLASVIEDGATFEANARKKAEAYSRDAAGELVIADDSGLEVDALGGAPGVHSARYAADEPQAAATNTDDEANNAKLVREIRRVPPEKRTGRFVCWIAAAREERLWRSSMARLRESSSNRRAVLTVLGMTRCSIFLVSEKLLRN